MAVMLVAATMMVVAATVMHGVVRPAMMARGVRPWRLRDSLAAAPAVMVGSGGIGAGVMIALSSLRGGGTGGGWPIVVLGAGVATVSWGVMLLGVMELRKLH